MTAQPIPLRRFYVYVLKSEARGAEEGERMNHYTIAVIEGGWWVSYAYRDGRKVATCSSRDSAEEAERAAAQWAGVAWG